MQERVELNGQRDLGSDGLEVENSGNVCRAWVLVEPVSARSHGEKGFSRARITFQTVTGSAGSEFFDLSRSTLI